MVSRNIMSVFLKEVKAILESVARVGCINAVSCTKVFKFTKVYDALLIHPTSYLGFKPVSETCQVFSSLNVEGRIMTVM